MDSFCWGNPPLLPTAAVAVAAIDQENLAGVDTVDEWRVAEQMPSQSWALVAD